MIIVAFLCHKNVWNTFRNGFVLRYRIINVIVKIIKVELWFFGIFKSENISNMAIIRKVKIRKRIITVFNYPTTVLACGFWLKITCGNCVVPTNNTYRVRNTVWVWLSFCVVIKRISCIVIRTSYSAIFCNCSLDFVYSICASFICVYLFGI